MILLHCIITAFLRFITHDAITLWYYYCHYAIVVLLPLLPHYHWYCLILILPLLITIIYYADFDIEIIFSLTPLMGYAFIDTHTIVSFSLFTLAITHVTMLLILSSDITCRFLPHWPAFTPWLIFAFFSILAIIGFQLIRLSLHYCRHYLHYCRLLLIDYYAFLSSFHYGHWLASHWLSLIGSLILPLHWLMPPPTIRWLHIADYVSRLVIIALASHYGRRWLVFATIFAALFSHSFLMPAAFLSLPRLIRWCWWLGFHAAFDGQLPFHIDYNITLIWIFSFFLRQSLNTTPLISSAGQLILLAYHTAAIAINSWLMATTYFTEMLSFSLRYDWIFAGHY